MKHRHHFKKAPKESRSKPCVPDHSEAEGSPSEQPRGPSQLLPTVLLVLRFHRCCATHCL